MIVTEFKENEDGSATCQLDMTDEEKGQLIQFAVVRLLEEMIAREAAEKGQ